MMPVQTDAEQVNWNGDPAMTGGRDAALSCVLRSESYRRMRWQNGAGWTSEILRVPEEAGGDDWLWRLSIAEVDQDGPFSVLPGVERELVLLSGNGMRLRFEGDHCRELQPPHGALRFAGEKPLTGELIDGPSRDFNLMWKRDYVDARLWHRPLVGMMAIFVEPGEVWAVYQLSGQAQFSEACELEALMAGDTAVLRASTGRMRYALEGHGEVLMIRVAPHSA